MGLKAAVQALKKAEELKARVCRHDDLLNNSEIWSDQQQLQTVYHQVLILDLEYALDKKVEQELWTLGFKNHIAALQHLSKDKKNPKRSEYQALLSWCLEAASGFYLTLLQELCTTFELDLPFRRRGLIYGQTKTTTTTSTNNMCNGGSEQPQKSSCLYICQYCLVHLGDIARYRSQRKQAESFYQHAILLSPSSGQPYNQLALLEASRGDKLATVFHYVRSISVKHPFPAAATNLANTLSAAVDHQESIAEVHSKLSIMEFLAMFLRVHGLLHLASDLDQAELYVKSLNATFTALVATHAFSSMKLIQMTAINLYALRYTLDSFSTEQLTTDELRVKHLILDLLAGAFSAYLLPIYTMPNDVTLLNYYALPAIKLTLDWIKTNPDVLNENVFTKKLHIWPSLCKLLNVLQTITSDCDTKNFDKIPLPEDRDLQCFLPLVNAYKDLDFTICVNPNYDSRFFNNLRVHRLIHLSVWLSTQNIDNNVLITAKKMKNPTKVIFEPCIHQPDPTTDLLNELKHFNIKEKDVEKSPSKIVLEKRGGILKPQGSLEKAREEREREQALILSTNIPSSVIEVNEPNNTLIHSRSIIITDINATKLKRNRQNVAMQALAKKVEENSKQVTFVTEPTIKSIDAVVPIAVAPTPQIDQQKSPINPFQNQMQPQQQQIAFKQNNIPFTNTFPMPSSFQNSVAHHPRQYQNYDLKPQQNFQSDQPYKNWLHDDKLPMPPSTWTSWPHNTPKNMRPFPPAPPPNLPTPLNNEMFHQNYPFNTAANSNNFMQDNIIPNFDNINRQQTTTNNNMSLWNSGPNFQPNLQMIFNQQSTKQNNSPNNLFNEPMVSDASSVTHHNPPVSSGGYSLFNSNWAPNLAVHSSLKYNNTHSERVPHPPGPGGGGGGLMRQQSLFSGPGPSPLERLLQQQKQQRGKEDT